MISRIRKATRPIKAQDPGTGSLSNFYRPIRRPGIYDHDLIDMATQGLNTRRKKALLTFYNQRSA